MKAELLNCVGEPVLRLRNIGSCSFSFNRNNFGFRSSIKNSNREFYIDSNFLTEYGNILSSIGAEKPILIFRPYLGTTFLEISMSGEDFLHLDTQFTQPLVVKNIPFKVHAECINNKPLFSIEYSNTFSYSKNIKGLLCVKYGKSLDFDVNVILPFNESHFSVDSNHVQFDTNFGVHNNSFGSIPIRSKFLLPQLSSFFITYKLSSDYIMNNHQFGCYLQSRQKSNILSILYNLNQKKINMKAETNINRRLSLAYSAGIKLNDQKESNKKQFDLTDLQVGTTFIPFNKYDSKFNFQIFFPNYKAITQIQGKLKQKFNIDLSTSYDFCTKSFEFGFNLSCDSNK